MVKANRLAEPFDAFDSLLASHRFRRRLRRESPVHPSFRLFPSLLAPPRLSSPDQFRFRPPGIDMKVSNECTNCRQQADENDATTRLGFPFRTCSIAACTMKRQFIVGCASTNKFSFTRRASSFQFDDALPRVSPL